MCKLYAVVEIENQNNAEFFTKKAIPYITETDNHGLGIMRLGERGIHVQRWLEPPTVVRRKESKVLQKYYEALHHQQNEAGNKSTNLYAIAVHGRFATCARTLQNVHPFYKGGTALMHNGIISNSHEYEKTISTCDSEAILSQYLQHNVKKNPHNLTDALKGMTGYYAAIAFSDNGTIDIWRDDTASLFMAHVKGVGVVIATTKEIITKTARKCKAFITGIDEILPYAAIRWTNGVSPQIGMFEAVKPVERIGGYGKDIIEIHKNSVSDASDYEQHWWDLEEMADRRQAYDDAEEKRVREWQRQEDEDERKLKELQGIIKHG